MDPSNGHDDQHPLQPLSLKHLHLIKWIPDGDTTTKKLKIAETIAPKWRDVAKLLGLSHSQIARIENPGSGKTPDMCLDEVLDKWYEKCDEAGFQDYPYTWDGLLELLEDIECGVLASDLKNGLSNSQSSVKGNLGPRGRSCVSEEVDDPISLLSAKEQSELLQSHVISIYELLDVDILYPSLCQEGLLNDKEKKKLTKYGRSKEQKITKLLAILSQKEPDAVKRFLRSLRQTQDHANHNTLLDILYLGGEKMESPSSSSWRTSRTVITVCLLITVTLLFSVVSYTYMYHPGVFNFFDQYQSNSLPCPSKVFVGREQEMSKLKSLLDFYSDTDTRIVNLVGSPGFGKSTLAIHLGNYMVKQGILVHYVNMAEYHEEQDMRTILSEKILTAVGDEHCRTIFSFEALLRWLRMMYWNSVVIIDDCDDLLQSKKESFFTTVQTMVEQTLRVKILLTSRELSTRLEYLERFPVYELSSHAACELLEKKLPSNTNLLKIEIEEIARLTGNVPLALKIIGALLSSPNPPSPSVIISELKSHPIPLLSHEEIPHSDRINVSISLSYRYLSPEMQNIGQYLASFPGSFDRNAAHEILAGNQVDFIFPIALSFSPPNNSAIIRTMNYLVSRSLIEFNSQTQRYKFHRLIQEFFKEMRRKSTGIGTYFIPKFQVYYSSLLSKTVRYFEEDYKKSLHSLYMERHNYQSLLDCLRKKEHKLVPFIRMMIAISQALLNSRLLNFYFSESDIIHPLQSALDYIDTSELLLTFFRTQRIKEMSYDTFRHIYVTLVYEVARIEKNLLGIEKARVAYEQRKHLIQFVMSSANGRVNDHTMIRLLAKLNDELEYREEAKEYHISSLLHLVDDDSIFKCHVHLKRGEMVRDCSYRSIGMAYHSLGDYKQSAVFFELSYETEKNAGMEKVLLVYDMIRVYTSLERVNKVKIYAQELGELIGDDLVSTLEVYNSRSKLLVIIRNLKMINQQAVASILENKLVEIITDIEGEARSCFQAEGTLQMMEYYYQLRNKSMVIQLGQALLSNWKLCTGLQANIDQSVETRARILTGKAKFNSGYFSQGMDELENLITSMSLETFNQNEISDICWYLIPRRRYVMTCYPWVLSIPAEIVKVVLYLIFVIPLDPYSSVSPVYSSPLPSKSTYPEINMFTSSKDVGTLKLSEVGFLQVHSAFSSKAKGFFNENITWAWSVASDLTRFFFQFTLVRFVVNTLSVLIRIHYFFSNVFSTIMIIMIMPFLFISIPLAIWGFLLLRLMLRFPFLLFPATISLVKFIFKVQIVFSRYIILPCARIYFYILAGFDLYNWMSARGLIDAYFS